MSLLSNRLNKKMGMSASNSVADQIRKRMFFLGIKRLVDIIISVLFITLVLSWLIPIVSLLIFIDSRSPIFFLQRRVGRFGKTFFCLKFRTMYKNIEADFKQATEDDPRITRLGRVLRLTNIDELPQFLNVLMGDMSIVGPRPHMYKDCRDFNEVVKNYKLRSFVKPGITGMAQIKGFRGPTETEQSIIHRFKWDVFYVRKASFLLDIFIITTTFTQTVTHFFSVLMSFANGNGGRVKNVQMQTKKQIAA